MNPFRSLLRRLFLRGLTWSGSRQHQRPAQKKLPSYALKLIGYWAPAHWPWARSSLDQQAAWPDVRRAVRPEWRVADRERLVAYLRAGHGCRTYLGFSACRFECRDKYRVLGNCDLTDGEWVWPVGLSHYVDRHAVMLPDEFIASASARGWKVPPKDQVSWRAKADYDYSPWL